MDNLKFCCSWKGSLQGAKFNVKIGGLQLEGCSFDGSRLSENQRDSPSISGIPPCMVAWIKVRFLYFSLVMLLNLTAIVYVVTFIHVNSHTFSWRLPLSSAIFSKIFLKIRGIFTD
jgi:hypothetical protein